MSLAKHQANSFNLEQIGWKYYNTIKRKAVEQEFSWSGLLISLSIAFFVVALSALTLKFVLLSVGAELTYQNKKIYYLEKTLRADSAIKRNLIYINIS